MGKDLLRGEAVFWTFYLGKKEEVKLRLRCEEVWSTADRELGIDRFSRDRPRFTDTLDVIKFLCKDMWALLFRKQIDNLKTNHRV